MFGDIFQGVGSIVGFCCCGLVLFGVLGVVLFSGGLRRMFGGGTRPSGWGGGFNRPFGGGGGSLFGGNRPRQGRERPTYDSPDIESSGGFGGPGRQRLRRDDD